MNLLKIEGIVFFHDYSPIGLFAAQFFLLVDGVELFREISRRNGSAYRSIERFDLQGHGAISIAAIRRNIRSVATYRAMSCRISLQLKLSFENTKINPVDC